MKIIVFPFLSDPSSPSVTSLSIPDSCVARNSNPVFVPEFDSSFRARIYFAVKISRLGKSIALRFAPRYYEEIAPALLITATDTLASLQSRGLPWTDAVAFDKSCPVGSFLSAADSGGNDYEFSIATGENIRFSMIPREMIHLAISTASLNNTLKMGDLILIPAPVDKDFELHPDTIITISKGDRTLMHLPVK